MAKQFQFDEFDDQRRSRTPQCSACEEMLTDAVDESLDDADRAWFHSHVSTCAECSERLAEAQRGAAWLEMLKTPRPEPSARLMERILAQTSGEVFEQPRLLPAAVPQAIPVAMPSNLLPFRPARPMAATWARRAGAIFEPRLAMTAAMAFFSIALTLNLTGVQLNRLHLSTLRPSNLKHTYYAANAGAARYYDNLRVVRVMESRVEDLRAASADAIGTGDRSVRPESRPDAKPLNPGKEENKEKNQKKPGKGPGMSRREAPTARPHSEPDGDATRRSGQPLASLKKVQLEGGLG